MEVTTETNFSFQQSEHYEFQFLNGTSPQSMVEVRICDLAQLKKEEFKMAQYAELQRIKWHCIKGFDAIRFYKKYQYDKWYNSLTNEEKEKLKEEQELRSKKADRELCSALAQLSFLMGEVHRRALY